MKKTIGLIAVLVIFLTNCGSNSPSTPQVSVAISPSTQQSIDQGKTVNFTATVANDTSNAGVTWSLSGTGCTGTACGTLSNTTVTAATYTAPASVSSDLTVSVTATSKADKTKSASSTVVDKAITVSLAPSGPSNIDQGQTVNFTATVANDPASAGVTWSLSGTGCTGAACGTLSNTTTTAATYTAPALVTSNLTVSVTATSATNTGISTPSTVVVSPPAVITTTSLASGVVGTSYSQTLAATGGAGTLTWSITGTLPAGLNLNASTGVISGTPTAYGTSNFTVKVTDSALTPMTVSKPLSITINNPPLTITTTSLPSGLVGTSYNASLAAAGGTTPYTWSTDAAGTTALTGLGLSLNSSTGAITGTHPVAGTGSFTVTVTDSTTPTAQTQSKVLSITIYAVLAVTTTSLPNGSVGAAYGQNLAATGGATPYTWSVSGSLPAGLNLNKSTGVISGTPTAQGTSNFTVTVTDSTSPTAQTASQSLSITINGAAGGALSITTTTLPVGVLNAPYSATVGVGGGVPPYTWSVTGSLPPGLSLDASTGVISGTPTSTGTSNFSVTVTDSTTPTALTATQSLSIMVSTVAACTSSGNESIMSGHYAFSLSGFNSTGYLAVVGAFTADGTGKITAGEADSNGALGAQTASIDTTASSYSVGSDNRGCATIVTSFGTFTTRFSLGSMVSGKATQGRMIEWEAPTSSAYIATGQILQQTSSSFSSGLSGSYALSAAGVSASSPGGRFASSGVMTASGGAFSSGEADVNDAGTISHLTGMTGTYGSADSNGRLTGTNVASGISTIHLVYYMVSSSRSLFLSTDAASSNAVVAGEMQGQSGTFSNSSLNGKMVVYMAGLSSGGSGGSSQFGLATTNGSGSLTATIYNDDAGTWSNDTPSCNYSVAANGRVSLSGSGCGNHSPVLYLFSPNNGFILSTDPGVAAGQVEAQTGGSFSTSILSGAYYMGTAGVVNQGSEAGTGVVTLTGGTLGGTSDYTSTSSQGADQAISGTITVNSDGTIISSDHPGLVTGIIVSSSQVVVIDNQGSSYPTINAISK